MKRLLFRVAAATCLYSLFCYGETLPHWRQLVQQGDQQRAARALQQAESSYTRALRESEHAHEWWPEAVCLNRLGLLYKDAGRYSAAERFSRRALEAWERNGLANVRDVLVAKTNLGVVLHAERKYREAERLFAEVLESCLSDQGLSDPDTASALNNLGAVYHEQGRLEEAEKLYRRVYDQYDGQQSIPRGMLFITNNLALTYSAEGRWREADSLYRELLARVRSQKEPMPDLEATVLNNLGLECSHRGRKDEALEYLKEAVHIRDAHLGPQHPESVEAALNYASVLKQTKRKKEASLYEARGSTRLPSTVDVSSLLRRQ